MDFFGLQQLDRQDSQTLNIDNFCRLPVVSTQAVIRTEKYPDAGILLSYDDDDDEYSEGYHQPKEAFKALTKEDLHQPYKSDDDFRSSSVRAEDVGYHLYVFDIRYQQKFTASQPIKIAFKFDGVILKKTNGYALVLTNKLVSISSDEQRHSDLISVIFNFFIKFLFSFIANSVSFSNTLL